MRNPIKSLIMIRSKPAANRPAAEEARPVRFVEERKNVWRVVYSDEAQDAEPEKAKAGGSGGA
jgi:hypothetical protein